MRDVFGVALPFFPFTEPITNESDKPNFRSHRDEVNTWPPIFEEKLHRTKYPAQKRLKMEIDEGLATESDTKEEEAETGTIEEEEQEQQEEEMQDDEEEERRRDGRDTIGLPSLEFAGAPTKAKLRESMLEYSRRMAEYKNWRELRLQGSCVTTASTASAAAAAAGDRRSDGRMMPTVEGHRSRRRAVVAAAMAAAATSSEKAGFGNVEAVVAAAGRDATIVDSSPSDGTKVRRGLADALSLMLKSAAAAIKVDGKRLNRPSHQGPPRQQPQQRANELPGEWMPMVDTSSRRFVAAAAVDARAISPIRLPARQPPANGQRMLGADHSPLSRDAVVAPGARPNSIATTAAETGGDDNDGGESGEGIFEVVAADDSSVSIKRLLIMAAAAAAASVGAETFGGGRRPVRARRMKIPPPLLCSIVEDESEDNERTAAAAAAAARTAGRSTTFPPALAAVPEVASRSDVNQAEAAWRRDRRRSILLRLVNASNVAPQEVSKYMTSYARKKLLKLPALKASAERHR